MLVKKFIFYSYLFFPIVIPNTFRIVTIPFFILISSAAFFIGFKYIGKVAISIYVVFSFVSLFYIFIGTKSIDFFAVSWLTYVYMVSPFLWLSLWSYFLRKIPIRKIIDILLIYGFLGCLSIAAFYYIFIQYGPEYLVWLIATPNIEVDSGKFGATMHVFGSLIFLVSAFFSAPEVVANSRLRYCLCGIFIVSVFTSGRSALILAMMIGVLFNFLGTKKIDSTIVLKVSFYLFLGIPIFVIVLNLSYFYAFQGDGINIVDIFSGFLSKIAEGGGDERVQQFYALLNGIAKTYLLGAGHGSHVDLIRNDEMPWKYELLWVSTLYHVGLVGFLIYCIPLGFVLNCYIKISKYKKMTQYDRFIFSGFVSILIASMTNPYLESYDFQWMVVFPTVYFYRRYNLLFNNNYTSISKACMR